MVLFIVFLAKAMKPVKMILVTGGVISGVGKGIISSSLGVLLKAHGYRVSVIKIDPYINIDAGTFSPFEHGTVSVRNFHEITVSSVFVHFHKFTYLSTVFLRICDMHVTLGIFRFFSS